MAVSLAASASMNPTAFFNEHPVGEKKNHLIEQFLFFLRHKICFFKMIDDDN